MKLKIICVDYAPPELDEQVPIIVELLRQLAGEDRPDYWLGTVSKPIRWIENNFEREITHVVVAARWQGTQIASGVENLPIGIAYVTDLSLLNDQRFNVKKSSYVAIGIAHEIGGGQTPQKLVGILSGTIGRAFGVGNPS